ncbi:hypothetical protein C8R44DRAFT_736086 [Mycena epipterygia]|nr:hypothetical protein C8R44DRAFT_736086 [Mycena epipterygia]
MRSLLYILVAAVSVINAARLAPRVTYVYSIADFQGHMLDLSGGDLEAFTPVQSFTAANTTNQQWVLISTQDARQLYEIVNVGGTATIMSHTTALLKTPGPAIHAQIVASNETIFWRIAFASKATRFFDADSGLGLTAWPAAGGESSPLTLEYPDPKNKRQIFHLTCITGWSIPEGC